MATLTSSAGAPRTIGRGPWTSHDGYALLRFLVQSCGIVCAGVFLYSLGPFLGLAVLGGSLAAWLKAIKCRAATRAKRLADAAGEPDRPATSLGVP